MLENDQFLMIALLNILQNDTNPWSYGDVLCLIYASRPVLILEQEGEQKFHGYLSH